MGSLSNVLRTKIKRPVFARRPASSRVLWGAAILGAGGIFYAREIEPRWLEISNVEITLPRLAPEFDGYKIVQIGDIHLDDWTRPGRLKKVIQMVNEQRPDLTAIMGDFASYSARKLDTRRLVEALSLLSARDGVVAVLGNHDYLTDAGLIRRCIRESDIALLDNDALTLGRDAARLHVAGVDDVMEGGSRLDLVLEKLPVDGAALLLAHEPDFADVATATGRFDLQLSGHSHGGQVRLPLLTRLILPPYAQRYPGGLYEVEGMALYTNRGIGFVDARLRFRCRPEVTVLTLHSP